MASDEWETLRRQAKNIERRLEVRATHRSMMALGHCLMHYLARPLTPPYKFSWVRAPYCAGESFGVFAPFAAHALRFALRRRGWRHVVAFVEPVHI